MYLAPSKNESSPKSEKRNDSHLVKLFGQLRNALIDPSTSEQAMAGIAGLAIGPMPKLGEYLSGVAQNPDMRSQLLQTTSHLTGYQGPSLHDQQALMDKINELQGRMGGATEPTPSIPSLEAPQAIEQPEVTPSTGMGIPAY